MSVIKEDGVLTVVLPDEYAVSLGFCSLCGDNHIMKKNNYPKSIKSCIKFLTKKETRICNACNFSLTHLISKNMPKDNFIYCGYPKLHSIMDYRISPQFYKEGLLLESLMEDIGTTYLPEVDDCEYDDESNDLMHRCLSVIEYTDKCDSDSWVRHSAEREARSCQKDEECENESFVDIVSTQFIINLFNREQKRIDDLKRLNKRKRN